MRLGTRFTHLAFLLGVVLGMAGLGLVTAALVDAAGARLPVAGHAAPNRSQGISPTTASTSPPGADPVAHSWGNRRAGGGIEGAQKAGRTSVPEREERLRFLYRTAAAARKLPWVEVQHSATQSYTRGTVPPEFQMMGAMSPNP